MKAIHFGIIETIEFNTVEIVDGVEIPRERLYRHIHPCVKVDGAWQDTDISGEDEEVQALCNTTWTDEVKQAYKDHVDSNLIDQQPE